MAGKGRPPGPAPGLSTRIREHLEAAGDPVPSRDLARRFLRIVPAGEDALVALLSPLLAPAGIIYLPGRGWSAPPPRAPRQRTPSVGEAPSPDLPPDRSGIPAHAEAEPSTDEVTWTGGVVNDAFASAGGPRADLPLHRRVACAVEIRAGRIGRVSLVPIRQDGEEARSREIDGLDWRAIASLLEEADAIFTDPRRESPPLLMELARRALPPPARVRGLAAAVRGAVALKRGATPEEIAAALGAPWLDGGDAPAAAANIAACVESADTLRSGRAAAAERPAPGFLTWELIASLPERPGTYSFFDANGRLLYVGKSANLRRRLASYATEGDRRVPGRSPRRVLGLLHQVDRVEVRPAGSDLEALLDEADLISRRAPRANVQREVHERGRSYAPGRRRALLLPVARGRAVSAIFLDDGAYEGTCRIGPRGGGRREARAILTRLFAAPGARGEDPPDDLRKKQATRLITSWLASRREEITHVDLDACPGPAEAEQRLMAAIADFARDHDHPVIHR